MKQVLNKVKLETIISGYAVKDAGKERYLVWLPPLLSGWASIHRKIKQGRQLIYSRGHAMMGLSLGPASGKVIADLVNCKRPEVAIDAFHPERFS